MSCGDIRRLTLKELGDRDRGLSVVSSFLQIKNNLEILNVLKYMGQKIKVLKLCFQT